MTHNQQQNARRAKELVELFESNMSDLVRLESWIKLQKHTPWRSLLDYLRTYLDAGSAIEYADQIKGTK